MDVAEVKELRSSLQALLSSVPDDPAAVATELAELGWDDVVAEQPGAVSLLFEEVGRAGAATRLFDDTVLAELGIDPAGLALAFPLAADESLFAPALTVEAGAVTLDAVLRMFGTVPGHVLVPVVVAAGQPATLLRIPTVGLEVVELAALDETGGWGRVRGHVIAEPDMTVPTAVGWEQAVATGRRLLAAELVGLAAAALQLATSHVTEREQFGRAIGSFQAVRFRLAETKVAIEAATEAIRVAGFDDTPLTAAVAKSLAGSALDTSVRNAAQVCGAMGLTWEFGLHSIIRRGYALDTVLGSAAELTAALGRYVIQQADAGRPLAAPDPLVVATSG